MSYDNEKRSTEREGTKAGIPYNWKKPTGRRLRDTYWNKESPTFFPPKAFGAGWAVNFYWLLHPAKYWTMKRSKTN
jgi:hypothetical protein